MVHQFEEISTLALLNVTFVQLKPNNFLKDKNCTDNKKLIQEKPFLQRKLGLWYASTQLNSDIF